MTAPIESLIQIFPVRIPVGFEPHAHGERSSARLNRACDSGSYMPGWGRVFDTPLPGGGTHDAIDIAAQYGAKVVATCPGTVFTQWYYPRATRAPRRRPGASATFLPRVGGYVRIQGPEDYVIYYAHILPVFVSPGDRVRTGQLLGYVYHAGTRGGLPHLHYQIRAPYPLNPSNGGRAINPRSRLEALKVDENLGWRERLLPSPYEQARNWRQDSDQIASTYGPGDEPELMPNPYQAN
jgi:murein DD-endopeptidase MepM/ murein hydrolase activator NlpD